MTAQEIRTASTTVYFDVDVRFGSLADLFTNDRRTAAFGGKADVKIAKIMILKGRFRPGAVADYDAPSTPRYTE